MIFEKFRKWINGKFTCVNCGETFSIMSFGYGKGICPNCYRNEDKFLFLDNRYWLNRLLLLMYK